MIVASGMLACLQAALQSPSQRLKSQKDFMRDREMSSSFGRVHFVSALRSVHPLLSSLHASKLFVGHCEALYRL